MIFRVIAELTTVVHFAFVAFVAIGGFLAWRWPRLIFLHVPAVAWGFSAALIGIECPLTHLENWARRASGGAELPSTGFIDHYLTGVIYPENAMGLVQALVLGAVVASWIGFGWRQHRLADLTNDATRTHFPRRKSWLPSQTIGS